MTHRHTLSIDIETYSSIDLAKSGVYRYVESIDFQVLIIAYSLDGGSVEAVEVPEACQLDRLKAYLTDPAVLKTAHNAAFEMACLSKFFRVELDPAQWECTMVRAAMMGLPLSLEQVARVLGLQQQKDAAGKSLIRYFCVPCKPTTANGQRTRNLPHHNPEKWSEFVDYCMQDVRTEMAVRDKVLWHQIPEKERRMWILDQQINRRGVMVDAKLVRNAIEIDEQVKARHTLQAAMLTGLENPNSPAQLKSWLTRNTGQTVDSLTKEATETLLAEVEDDEALEVLGLRQELSKTSVKKYAAMLNGLCNDQRVRGLLQYYGANRTGRWAGRLVQVQNLPRQSEAVFGKDLRLLDLARELVRSGDAATLELLFDSTADILSGLVRTAFVAPCGHRFVIADFSAIEARVIAWLAGERWRLEVFKTHGKIYEASAAQMFKVPIEQIGKGSPLRQKGKVSELALGYQGGPGALINMGALKMGIPEEELPKLVKMWRNANPFIVKLWGDVEAAAKDAVQGNPRQLQFGLKFAMRRGCLFITLPSGRELVYMRAKLQQGRYGGEVITYEGMDQTTKKWGKMETYGGKLVEYIIQAIARDCLAEKMLELDRAGYKIVMHVHDETVLEVPGEGPSHKAVDRLMGLPITWAPGLILTAESYETTYYKKD